MILADREESRTHSSLQQWSMSGAEETTAARASKGLSNKNLVHAYRFLMEESPLQRFLAPTLLLSSFIIAASASGDPSCPANCTCLPHQQHILCPNASLTTIPSGMSNGTLELYLQYNNFPTLPAGFIPDLPKLSSLYLSYCNICCIGAGAFEDLNNLRYLHLESNLLEDLQSSAFQNLSSLQYLHLENNRLSYLGPGVFSALKSLSALYLSHNLLTELSEQAFSGISQLRWLYLSSNRITNISSQAFLGLTSLRILGLDYNNLTSFPSAVRTVASLQVLHLSGNPIKKLTSLSFGRKLRSLEQLFLDKLGLLKVTSLTFYRLRRLKILSLRNNSLETLPALFSLKTFTSLLLSGNLWRCDCNMIWLHTWLQLRKSQEERSQVQCSSPDALQGQMLVNVELQKLTCPPFGFEVTLSPYKEVSGNPPVTEQPAKIPLPQPTTKATTPSTIKATLPTTTKPSTTASNHVPEKWDPCLSNHVSNIKVKSKGESSLIVTWSFSGDQEQFEVQYATKKTKEVLRVTGGLLEVELSGLQTGMEYTICVIPQNKDISKCLSPTARQCSKGQTAGTSGYVQPVHSPPSQVHSAVGTGVSITVVVVLVGLLLVGVYKLRSRSIRFQRYYDEDEMDNSNHFHVDPSKQELDPVYDEIDDDRHIYVMASNQWAIDGEEKLDCSLAASSTLPSTPRYINL
ncbi:leucine-rich repeat-containing protein 15-like [Rhinatrema bivittatum]|uniref:leucine-rich repeat-containing protein 15-like n=1 Tax=Rhinatrema bivittatum TaxID=194408 RepID=UPI00112A4B4D|nr:leucine-rich repeat-containing protein 15-like [Rhinatrema bivittatum]